MHTSTIKIDVHLDNEKVPELISWAAADSAANMKQQAKAMMLAFWDGAEKSALRIDLWTKEMMVDEMADFFNRATHQQVLVDELKTFAHQFYHKSKELMEKG